MADIVVVHGAWGGGWEWTRVVALLRAEGHRAHAVTLTGLGDRAHLAGPAITLATHTEDILALIEMEDLHDVVLCGHSYGSMPVTEAAGRAGGVVAAVLYLDGFIPVVGESMLDLVPADFAELLRSTADDGWSVPCPFEIDSGGPMTGELAAWYEARSRPQPLRTFTDPVSVEAESATRCGYVRYLDGGSQLTFVRSGAERAAKRNWWMRDVAGIHDSQVTAPELVARAIREFVDYAVSQR